MNETTKGFLPGTIILIIFHMLVSMYMYAWDCSDMMLVTELIFFLTLLWLNWTAWAIVSVVTKEVEE